MPHTPLHEAIADWVAGCETAVESKIDGRRDTAIRLLREPSERNEAIWRACFDAASADGGPLDVDDWDIDMDDLVGWPREDRGLRWQAIIVTSLSAAYAQYDAESGLLLSLWEACEQGGIETMAAASKLQRPLSTEAKRGPGRARFTAAKSKRRGK